MKDFTGNNCSDIDEVAMELVFHSKIDPWYCYLTQIAEKLCSLPKAVLAGVASLLIQKETQERTTVRMQGM